MADTHAPEHFIVYGNYFACRSGGQERHHFPLEYTNRLRSEGQSLEAALVEAGEVRLRPILMTTLCAILGLLPLALGIGAILQVCKSHWL